MIEIIYKEEKTKANGNEEFFCLPKNIRQIGESRGTRRIYVEDYVYTFLRRMPQGEEEQQGHVGILLGRYKWKDGISYLFIQSGMEISDMEATSEHIRFTEKIWGEIHDKTENYFKGQEILGWFLRIPGSPFKINDVILHTHLNHFAGNDKVLFLMSQVDKEEGFFAYENGNLQRENGFYVYYEKNEQMQNYLIDFNENRSIEEKEEQSDQAVAGFRKAVEEKQEENIQHGAKKGAIYALATCAAAAVLGIGFAYAQDAGIWGDLKKNNNKTTVSETAVEDSKKKAEVTSATATPDPEVTVSTSADAEQQETYSAAVTPEPTATYEPEGTVTPTPTPDESKMQERKISETPTPTRSITNGTLPAETRETAGIDTAGTRSYLVRKGDTLSKISMEMYGNLDEIESICELNNLESTDLIYIGQKLLLP